MKNLNKLLLLFAFLPLLFVSCTSDPEPSQPMVTYDHGVLVVNEGNFFSGDGEISHYNKETGEVTNNLYQTMNGVVLAAYIEQVRIVGQNAYIVDSNMGGAKVVVVDKASFQERGRVEGLEIPRDVAVAGNKLFIADWGNYDAEGNYTNPNSFVAVADINGGTIAEKIPVSSRPQSIVALDGFIYVVCEASREILKINPTSLEIVSRKIHDASPKELLMSEGSLILYSTLDQKLHLDLIDPATLSSSKKVFDIPNSTRVVLDGKGQAWTLTSAYSADYSYTDNQVVNFSLADSGTPRTIFEARNLRGIGIDAARSHLYIADDNGIQGNGTVVITDLQGEEIQKLNVGRVPSKFYFY
jgi:DNA-binding beta-propeller fold protein YncE